MEPSLLPSGIDDSTILSMSDAEKYRLRTLFDLLDEATAGNEGIQTEMLSQANTLINTSNASIISIIEGMKASLENDLAISFYELDKIITEAGTAINGDINNAIDSIVQAGQSPVMSYPERIYYNTLSPAEAFNITASETANTEKVPADIRIPSSTPVVPPISSPPISIDPTLPIGTPVPPTFTVPGVPPRVTPPIVPTVPTVPGPPFVNPFPVVPPTIPPGSLPIEIHNPPGFYTCYIYVTQADGNILSVPINHPIGSPCPTGYHETPYMGSPVSPPTSPPISPPIGGTIGQCHSGVVNVPTGMVAWIRDEIVGTTDAGVTAIVFTPPNVTPPLGWHHYVIGTPYRCYVILTPQDANWIDYSNCFNPVTGTPGPPAPPVPPIPPVPPCPPGCVRLDTPSQSVNVNASCGEWDTPEKVCTAWELLSHQPSPPAPPANTGTTTLGFLGSITSTVLSMPLGTLTALPAVFSSLFGGASGNLLNQALNSAMSAGLQASNSLTDEIIKACGYSSGTMFTDMASLAVAGWAERLSAAPVTYLYQPLKYSLQFQAPQMIPDQSELDNIYLANLLSYDQWRCYTKAQGNLPYMHQLNMETKRSRIDSRQAVFLNRYKKLNDDEYKQEMRTLGFIKDKDKKRFEDSLVNLPGMSDIIRYMVRDVEDQNIVDSYDLDNQFTQKYTDNGKLKLWLTAQGIPEEVVKYAWRAHWEYPSNTALYEMIRRLRPGRNKDGITVTMDDALKMLEVNDVASTWRRPLLAVSFNPITRTETKRGYNIDAIERPEVVELLQDEGLNKDDAEIVAKILDNEKDLYKIAINSRRSAFTPKQIANTVAKGEMSEDDAKRQLTAIGFKEDAIQRIMDSAMAKSVVIKNQKCLKSIRRQYFLGAMDYGQMRERLKGLGLSSTQVNITGDAYLCEFNSMLKDIPASKSVEWFVRGIIDISELNRRLTNLHYDNDAKQRWVTEAVQKRQEAFQKLAEKIAAAELKLRKAQQAALLAATKQAAAEYQATHCK